jgi:hypothetical protein
LFTFINNRILRVLEKIVTIIKNLPLFAFMLKLSLAIVISKNYMNDFEVPDSEKSTRFDIKGSTSKEKDPSQAEYSVLDNLDELVGSGTQALLESGDFEEVANRIHNYYQGKLDTILVSEKPEDLELNAKENRELQTRARSILDSMDIENRESLSRSGIDPSIADYSDRELSKEAMEELKQDVLNQKKEDRINQITENRFSDLDKLSIMKARRGIRWQI